MRIVVAGLAAFVALDGARAEDGPPPAAEAASAKFMVITGADVWQNGSFAHSAVVWSPYGLDSSGLTFKLLAGMGTYRYLAGGAGGVEVTGRQYLASVMPGWRFKYERLELTVFAGLDVQDHLLTPDDPDSTVRGTMYGARVGADLWYEPWPSTMLASNASISSIGPSYWTRAAAGVRVFDMIWLGPEALALGDPSYQQYRVGAHATGLKTKWFEWSVGAGWVTDSDQREGYYTRLGILLRR